jgi:vacuolar-type H+-ATPase subunit E/Vma4
MSKSACRYTVRVHRKDQLMTKIVNEESFTVGRSMDCAISLSEDSISRVHLIVSRKNNQILVEDKGSSNGTFLNDAKMAQNTFVSIIPSDKIRIGKSEYVLNIELEVLADESPVLKAPEEPMPAIQQVASKIAEKPTVAKEEKRSGDVFIHKLEANPVPQRPVAKVEAAYPENPAMFEGERILHEAHKKAAQIIYEGEAKAEKRVQAIYIQAREKQAEADAFYQKKISDAHKQADSILVQFQTQGQELIAQARHFAEEMRDEVELYVQNARDKTKQEVEDIISQAKDEAEVIKNETYEKALSKAGIDAEDMVANARSESQDILSFARLQSEQMLTTARIEIQDQIKDLQFQAEEKQKALIFIKKEFEDFTIKVQGDKEERDARDKAEKAEREAKDKAEKEEREARDQEWQARFKSLKSEVEAAEKVLSKTASEEEKLAREIAGHRNQVSELQKQVESLTSGKKSLELRNKELQEQLGRFQLDIQAGEDRKRQIDRDYDQQRQQVKERLEKESRAMAKDSEERMQDAQLEIGRRMEKIERDLFDEIISRRDKIVKEVLVVVETRIAKVLEPSKWDEVSSLVFEGVQAVIEGKAISFNGMPDAPKQSQSLARKKKKEHLRWMTGGIVAGVALVFLGLHVRTIIAKDQNPMRTIANEESRKKKEDLERRKFNPPQVTETKDNYTDSVIYTAGYVSKYQDAEFQQKMYKAASSYLLKTWRVDEDKSIQVLSMASALVKELGEKKENIHPDFVKDGIAKMRALEKESLNRMKAVLGSEVRLESFRRFENKFYEEEAAK